MVNMTRAEKRNDQFQQMYNELVKEGRKPTKALKETRKKFNTRNIEKRFV